MQQFISQPNLTEYRVSTRSWVDGNVVCDAAYLVAAISLNLRSEEANKPALKAPINPMWLGMPKRLSGYKRIGDNPSEQTTDKRNFDDQLDHSDYRTNQTLKSQTQQTNRQFHAPVAHRGGREG